MQIFNKKDDTILLLNDLKIVQKQIKELQEEIKSITTPPLVSLCKSDYEDITDLLIPLLTGYCEISDLKKIRRMTPILDKFKEIGTFLINLSDVESEHYKLELKIKELRDQERQLKNKLGLE